MSENTKSTIERNLLKSFTITDYPEEEIWKRRKELFFKPKTAFGSRGVYRGSSIARKAFGTVYNDDFLAQEYFPPSVLNDFKVDLRFYTYRNEIQLAAARLYQGQVTNVRTLGGGLATLEIV